MFCSEAAKPEFLKCSLRLTGALGKPNYFTCPYSPWRLFLVFFFKDFFCIFRTSIEIIIWYDLERLYSESKNCFEKKNKCLGFWTSKLYTHWNRQPPVHKLADSRGRRAPKVLGKSYTPGSSCWTSSKFQWMVFFWNILLAKSMFFPKKNADFSGFLSPQAIRGASFTQKVDKRNGVKTRPLKPGRLHPPRWHKSTCHSSLDIFLSSQFIQERWKS